MRIFNIMVSRKLGGLEQSFLDYRNALRNHDVMNITSSFAAINNKTDSIKLPNFFPWCIFSKLYLYILILIYRPDVIICHGGRSINFASFSKILKISTPIIAVSHGYSIKHILKCDYIIALDESLKEHFINHGFPKERIFIAPNMIDIKKYDGKDKKDLLKQTHIVGTLGRLEEEKGFIYLIEAIKILKDQNYNIKLKIAGSGSIETDLHNKVKDLNIEDNVEFLGWIENKDILFNNIDIFCAPSIFESFGIVALEAMSKKLPIVVSDASGFQNIFENNKDALIVGKKSSKDIASAIKKLVNNQNLAINLGQNAYNKAILQYDKKIVTELINNIVIRIHSINN